MAKTPRMPGEGSEPTTQPIQQTPQQLPAGLPNAIDIDPKTLTAPVLTRQGWVCPPDRVPPNRG